ncbi:predicted protein [Naegleria gruberi]|uniref:Predicted protein n=1 Tax=Naegleria gruberi TaxID=5762 RepID=D2VZJ6_NAEGR|nr:uncharacterized protein NAEGRDRAFT_53514 [Naegleria gruberi]EFC37858.1 predicted protein [Naegleria gruberi]|eukprot:XP_002670602.1 predicted protein [Naegleria gruberi strain NEG-M]
MGLKKLKQRKLIANSSITSSNTPLIKEEKEEVLFDYVEKEIDEDLICSICLHPFVDPISHNSCGNTFCAKCIENVTVCPLCNEGGFKKNCAASAKTIRNMLDKLKVKCGMCKNIVLRGELKDHQEKYCPLHEAYQQVEEFKSKLEREHLERMAALQTENEQLLTVSKDRLASLEQQLIDQFRKKEELLETRMNEFENQVLAREKLENSNKPIHLNVRGTIMTVSLGDFTSNQQEPDNLFKKMFNGEYPCYQTPASKQFDDPIYFIDCNPLIFSHILD